MCHLCFLDALPGLTVCANHRSHARDAERQRHDADPLRKFYKCKAWLVTRRMVLAAQPMCTWHGGCNQPSTDIHHVIDAATWIAQHPDEPAERTFYMQENLAALCHAHHSLITGQAR